MTINRWRKFTIWQPTGEPGVYTCGQSYIRAADDGRWMYAAELSGPVASPGSLIMVGADDDEFAAAYHARWQQQIAAIRRAQRR